MERGISAVLLLAVGTRAQHAVLRVVTQALPSATSLKPMYESIRYRYVYLL